MKIKLSDHFHPKHSKYLALSTEVTALLTEVTAVSHLRSFAYLWLVSLITPTPVRLAGREARLIWLMFPQSGVGKKTSTLNKPDIYGNIEYTNLYQYPVV